MRVFVTGATGFIGMAVVQDLIAAGHQVIGLCRDPAKAKALAATGARVHPGALEDQAALRAGIAQADGVIHLAFNHDFSRFVASCQEERQVVATLGGALAGSDRPLLVTSGTAIASTRPGQPAQEDDPITNAAHHPRAATEEAAGHIAADGVNVSVVRLPQVHDTSRQGLITPLIAAFRQHGTCAMIGDGHQRWPAAHVTDVARLYRLALERAQPEAHYHAVAEEGISMAAIIDTLARRLDLPVTRLDADQAQSMFGWLTGFAAMDLPAASARTRAALNWHPTGPGLLADLKKLRLDPA